MDIKIDASLSRDEKFSNIKTSDPDLLFSWEGPIKLNNIMKKYKIPLNENKILTIKAEEYKKHIQNIDYINTSFNYEFDFKLILIKNGRTAIKNIKVAIKITIAKTAADAPIKLLLTSLKTGNKLKAKT